MKAADKLKLTAELIDRAGGSTKVARRFGMKQPRVAMWKLRGFPPDTYLAWQAILKELRATAPAELWKQKQV